MAESHTSADLASFGEVAKVGTYTGAVKTIEAKESDDGNNYVTIAVEFLDGENEGLSGTIFVFPKVTKSAKNGKLYSRGIYEAQAMANAWGKKIADFPLDEFMDKVSVKGARLLQKMLGDSFRGAGAPKLKLRVVAEKMQEKDEKTQKWVDKKDPATGEFVYRNKIMVLGRAGSAPTAAGPTETAQDAPNEESAPLTFS